MFLMIECGETDMVKMILSGCNGRMGKVITELVREDEGITICAGVAAVWIQKPERLPYCGPRICPWA